MKMIRLVQIDKKNIHKVANLKVRRDQKNDVAPNLYSLAEAYVNQDVARPYAIMHNDIVVGFLMLWWEEGVEATIWRFMIDKRFQNKGFGRLAMIEAINLIKASNKFDKIKLSVVETNTKTLKFYESFGFKLTGNRDDEEVEMALPIK